MENSGNHPNKSSCPRASTTHVIGRPIRVDMQFAVATAAYVGLAAIRKRHTP